MGVTRRRSADTLQHSNTVLGKSKYPCKTDSNNGYLGVYLVGLFRGTALTSVKFLSECSKL